GAMLMPAIDDAVARFARREGVSVTVLQGGCGLLVSQMETLKAGKAPGNFPDAYFASDSAFLTPVRQWFQPPVIVSRNALVLVPPKGSPQSSQGLPDLVTRRDLRVGLSSGQSALRPLTRKLLEAHELDADALFAAPPPKNVFFFDAGHVMV